MLVCDGSWELVHYEPQSQRVVWRYDDGTRVHFRTDYPVTEIIEENQRLLEASQAAKFENGQRVASIPLNLFYSQLHEACRQGDRAFISRWLNDGDNRAFRTFRGHI